MKVYKSTNDYGMTTFFDAYMDVLEEFKAFLDNATTNDGMKYEIVEMSEENFKKIQEL